MDYFFYLLEAPFVTVLPLSVDDLESDVLVRRPGPDAQNDEVLVVGTDGQRVGRRACLEINHWSAGILGTQSTLTMSR